MKNKLLGFAVALASVATIGVVQLTTNAAEPGKVGNAPLCKVTAVGERASAFKINGANTLATVEYKVTGKKGCKTQVSTNSFNAPSINGKPYDKQVLFKRVTKIVTPGTYKNSVGIPTNKAKGCFYQVDLTYGTRNVTPVIAYGHGKVNSCKNTPTPKEKVVVCNGLNRKTINRNTVQFTAKAVAKNGAKINGYLFTVKKGSTVVKNDKVKSPVYTYTMPEAGDYTVQVTVLSSEGKVTGPNCTKPISLKPVVTQELTPAVAIDKLVEGADYYATEAGVEYKYQIKVTNTGETTLSDVAVSDTPENGVTLLSASNGTITGNTWTYSIPELAIGASADFTLTAEVPTYLAGKINNTACVDAPTVPGNPDDCDDAVVEVEEPGNTIVCNPETNETISVEDKDADKYVPVGSEECEETPVTPETPSTPNEVSPEELPTTGPAETILQLVGATSLAGAGSYYLTSRRQG